ncbi:helix-turn-helix transcriptional regulator [Clostridium sp. JS66]|uniref:helix-turn-helix domain-containing protein n=1 Tax=Clostridium sp. JS66 TaxID=3064705 RepID=UPI00298DDE01|nr:helix-turn-helix transcriptional regulator [Clostridium sp. JS66]WPC42796.1 helix-turn-helix transcriptional regulator [Clostridium sp. JS66]
MENNIFGKRVNQLRKQRNLSLDELSDITDISKSYLSRIENGKKRNITIFVISKLSNALDMDIRLMEKLLMGVEDKQDDKVVESIDWLLINDTYIFATKIATMEIQLLLRDVINSLEDYCVKENISKKDDDKLLEIVCKLRSEVLKLD